MMVSLSGVRGILLVVKHCEVYVCESDGSTNVAKSKGTGGDLCDLEEVQLERDVSPLHVQSSRGPFYDD